MKLLKWAATGIAALALVACGGGGGSAGDSVFSSSGSSSTSTSTTTTTTTTTTSSAATVEVLSSATTAGSGGDIVTVTAVVKSAANVGLASTAVVFSTDSGTLTSPSTTTDSTGVATAKFYAGADKSNRSAKITVTSGTVSGSVLVAVTGSKLQVSGPTTLALSASGDLTVKATDSNGNAIAGVPLAIKSALSNGLSASTGTTDSQGQVTVKYTATNSGTDTITFSGVGTSITSSMVISSEDFVFVSPSASTLVAVKAAQTVQVRYRQNGVGVSGKTILFASTGGVLSSQSATTDSNGVAQVSISSTFAAPATVQASLSGGTAVATLPLVFTATTPSRLILQVSPTAIGPNSGTSTTNQARVLARVLDADGNPVAGQTVYFQRDADPSGGNLLQASAVTDSSGLASVQYASGAQSTGSNGVSLRATVYSASSAVAATNTMAMTVSQSALFIALGTGNVISNLDEQTYKKSWVAYVTDANGVPVSGSTLTVKVLPTRYLKGSMVWSDTAGQWVAVPAAICANEDVNLDGILDAGEDVNSNGTLQPGNVVSVSPGLIQTDSAGRATLSLVYAESYAPWVEIQLTVQAIVSGTESTTASSPFIVDVLASDVTTKTISPAGRLSPFGQAASCSSPN